MVHTTGSYLNDLDHLAVNLSSESEQLHQGFYDSVRHIHVLQHEIQVWNQIYTAARVEAHRSKVCYMEANLMRQTETQLEGTAKSWWDSYCDSHHDPAHISWEEFARAFREQHVPRQVMIQKAQEFRTMTQGTMKVEEYERHFTKMMRYAADDTNTEEKKQFWFLRGLHHGIRQIVTGCEYPSLHSLVNRAIAVERERLGWEDRQRNKKLQTDHQVRDRPFQKARNAPPLPPRSGFRPGSSQPSRNCGGGGNHYSGNRTHGGQNQGGGNYHRQQPAQRTNSGSTPFVCFTCNKPGHKSYECPEKKTSTPARALGSAGRPAQAPRSADRGRLTHLTEEEARDAPDVVTGEYLINGSKALVLFDSGATCSYVSSKCVAQKSLPMTPRSHPIITSSPLGDHRCTLACKGVKIMIQGLPFTADLTSTAVRRDRCYFGDGLVDRTQGCHILLAQVGDPGTP
jgi:hypothetical protein